MTPQGSNQTNPEAETKWAGLFHKPVFKKKKKGGKGCTKLKEM